jgi:ABC-2 type transport system ATP-binding protein
MSPRAIAAKGSLGYVPQEIALYPDLTGRENLLFFAGLYGLRRREARSRADEVLEAVSLRERAKDLARTYSGGMQRRLNIAIGLLHRPRLLVLDEPTVGVDPQSRNAILTGIEALSAQGMAVLYTTHYMEEAQRLCDRIGIVEGGRLIAEGTARELTALVGGQDRIVLAATGELSAAAAALNAVADVHSATHGPDGLEVISADAGAALPAVLAAVAAAGVAVRSVAVSAPDLESVFLHLTGKTLRD